MNVTRTIAVMTGALCVFGLASRAHAGDANVSWDNFNVSTTSGSGTSTWKLESWAFQYTGVGYTNNSGDKSGGVAVGTSAMNQFSANAHWHLAAGTGGWSGAYQISATASGDAYSGEYATSQIFGASGGGYGVGHYLAPWSGTITSFSLGSNSYSDSVTGVGGRAVN